MNINWKGLLATFAIMLILGEAVKYYQVNYVATSFQKFASQNICIPKNSTFTIYLQGGAQIHYDGISQRFTRPEGMRAYNGTGGAFVAFCYNQSILKDCVCKEAQQEYCGMGQEGFSLPY